jgi:hypothetical protein
MVMANRVYSAKTVQAFRKYGFEVCKKAFEMSVDGYGARGISLEGPSVLKTTSQADAAVNAGREYVRVDTLCGGKGFPCAESKYIRVAVPEIFRAQ